MATNLAQSERLWLRVLSLDNLEDFKNMMNDPRSKTFAFSPEKREQISEEKARELILDNCPSPEKPYSRKWAIILRPDSVSQELKYKDKGRLIGAVGIPRPDEIGYRVHPDFWGKGYMKEALGLAIKLFWGLEESKNSNKLTAAADPENFGSIKVLEFNGFSKEELKKDFYEREVDGELRKADMQFFSLSRPQIDSARNTSLP